MTETDAAKKLGETINEALRLAKEAGVHLSIKISDTPQKSAARRSPPPTQKQLATLKWINGNGGEATVDEIPRKVAWYAGDVLKRLAGRGWLIEVSDRRYAITDAGRALAEAPQ